VNLRCYLPVLTFAAVLMGPGPCRGQGPLSADTLISEGRRYDRKEVLIAGEAIGDIMKRKNGCWVNILTDGGGAIGVLANEKYVRAISVTGDYSHRGDQVAVRGTMYRYAPMLGGETCIIADDISVVRRGYEIQRGMPWHRLFAGLILTGVSLVMWVRLRGYLSSPSDGDIARNR